MRQGNVSRPTIVTPTPPIAKVDFGDATATVVQRDRRAGMELWSVSDRGRLWTAYHETYVFCWAHQQLSDQAWFYRGRRYSATTQTTMLIEPGEIHRTIRGGLAGFHLLWLQPDVVPQLLDARQLHFRDGQTAEDVVCKRFAQMCQVVASSREDSLAREESVLSFLHILSRVSAEPMPTPRHALCPPAVKRVREFLYDHCGDDLRLDDLTAVAGLSKYHLCRLFLRQVGVSLHRYRMLVRLAKARDLLLRGTPICDAAGALGFYDQSHFHHAFFRTYGMTPRRFCIGGNKKNGYAYSYPEAQTTPLVSRKSSREFWHKLG